MGPTFDAMPILQNMNESSIMAANNSTNASPAECALPAPASLARRRLLRGGLGAVPVVLTVSSPSVMATGGGSVCTPASSFASINTSRPDRTFGCSGRTPGYWKQPQHYSNWPTPFVAKGDDATKFNDVFGSAYGYPGKTLLDVLELQGGDRNAVARHIVAALLNAAKNWTSPEVLSVTTVKLVWLSFTQKGYYEPTAGIRWFAGYSQPAGNGSLEDWLKSTMPV